MRLFLLFRSLTILALGLTTNVFSDEVDELFSLPTNSNNFSVDTNDFDDAVSKNNDEIYNYQKKQAEAVKSFFEDLSSSISNTSDLQSWCLGASSRENESDCYSIKSIDLKNSCLGLSKDTSFCYSIINDDIQNGCLGMSLARTYCYSIKSNDLRNQCLGVSDSADYCYSIKNDNLKNSCLGVKKERSYCYSITK